MRFCRKAMASNPPWDEGEFFSAFFEPLPVLIRFKIASQMTKTKTNFMYLNQVRNAPISLRSRPPATFLAIIFHGHTFGKT